MSAGPLVNVICMKWGKLYGPEYVNHLRAGVARHLSRPHRFVCFTDDATGIDSTVETMPLPSLDLRSGERDLRWRKLAVFRAPLNDLVGPTLFLDLDLVVVDSLEPFFALPDRFLIIRDDDLFRAKPLRRLNPARDRFKSVVGNSSVFRFECGEHGDVLEAYTSDPASAGATYENEQEFLTGQLEMQGLLRYWPRGWCVSFKNDCVPRGAASFWRDPVVPAGARIVVFAGTPKMSDVLAGHGQTWYRRIGNVDWLRRAWTGAT
jgi:hypothetical protein